MVTRSEPGYTWDFCGGHLAIDFTNTVGNRGATREEHFNHYADLLSWAESRGVLGRAAAQRLRREAARNPAAAGAALGSALELREALYGLTAAAAAGRKPAPGDLAVFNRHAAASFSGAHLAAHHEGLALSFADNANPLEAPILAPVTRAAIDLLTSDLRQRVRICGDASCAWLFVDTTRSGTRRWCDMKICGNRNKVRRFREGQTV
jgi:predicted RNA-binding Zn ribbon-like protein